MIFSLFTFIRIVQMEKELLYYKSITQELRKKLQAASDVNLSGSINSGVKRGLFRSGLVEKDIISSGTVVFCSSAIDLTQYRIAVQ